MRYVAIAAAFVLGLAVAWFGFRAVHPSEERLSAVQSNEVRDIVGRYLRDNPDAVIDAIRTYQQREEAAQESAQQRMLKERWDELAHDPRDPVLGNPAGDVTLVEFFDYRCPYCKRVVPTVAQLIKDDPKVRVVLKEYPILGKDSIVAARAALAAQRQGRYSEFHHALMDGPGQIDEARVMATAGKIGLDVERLKADMQAPEVEKQLRETYELARELGITGTPAFVVGDKVVPGAVGLDSLKQLVEQARKKTS